MPKKSHYQQVSNATMSSDESDREDGDSRKHSPDNKKDKQSSSNHKQYGSIESAKNDEQENSFEQSDGL